MPSWRSGHAAACRAAILPFKSGTWLRGLCGHSREVPPGPIPNPAVKLSCVDYCTQIREFSGTSQRCNPLPFVETILTVILNTKAKALFKTSLPRRKTLYSFQKLKTTLFCLEMNLFNSTKHYINHETYNCNPCISLCLTHRTLRRLHQFQPAGHKRHRMET